MAGSRERTEPGWTRQGAIRRRSTRRGVRWGISAVLAFASAWQTMLSLRCVSPTMPMMAALSAAHLAAVLLPEPLRRLYIARDVDPAGNVAAERAKATGIEAIPLSPQPGDFNEDLRTLGADALRTALRIQIAPQDVTHFMELGA